MDFRTCFRFRLWLWTWLGRPEPIPSPAFRMLRLRLALHLSAHNSTDGQQKRNRGRNHTRKRSSPQITLLIAVIERAPHVPSLAHPYRKNFISRVRVFARNVTLQEKQRRDSRKGDVCAIDVPHVLGRNHFFLFTMRRTSESFRLSHASLPYLRRALRTKAAMHNHLTTT